MRLFRFFLGRVGLAHLLLVVVFLTLLVVSSVKVSASRANEIQAYEEELPPVTVVKTTDLKSDGRLSRNTQKPILIMFSMEGCGYCQFVEEEHLKPMLRNQQYMQKVIIRKIMTDSYDQLVDFDGSKISAMDLAMRYRANVTPTVVFLNHQGKQLSKRILGVQNTEFYGGELDNGLEVSLHKIRQQLASAK